VDIDLDPDSLVEALTPDDAPEDVVPFSGFLGRGPEGHVRLFVDPELKVWFDIPVEHVVHRHRIPAERGTFGESSMIWVKSEWVHRPLFTEAQRDAFTEEFLIGEFALDSVLPETIADALQDAAEYVRRTTMHSKHCPK
jgi:hypothetical protein